MATPLTPRLTKHCTADEALVAVADCLGEYLGDDDSSEVRDCMRRAIGMARQQRRDMCEDDKCPTCSGYDADIGSRNDAPTRRCNDCGEEWVYGTGKIVEEAEPSLTDSQRDGNAY